MRRKTCSAAMQLRVLEHHSAHSSKQHDPFSAGDWRFEIRPEGLRLPKNWYPPGNALQILTPHGRNNYIVLVTLPSSRLA